jgi:hypothetical protein
MGKLTDAAKDHFRHPGPMDTNDLGPEMFCDGERKVINWAGANYFRACGEFVRSEGEEGTRTGRVTSTCVKPCDHPSKVHEDIDGVQRAENNYDFTNNELGEAVGLAIGAASMCWSETPTGVFDSAQATLIVTALLERIHQAGPIYG